MNILAMEIFSHYAIGFFSGYKMMPIPQSPHLGYLLDFYSVIYWQLCLSRSCCFKTSSFCVVL